LNETEEEITRDLQAIRKNLEAMKTHKNGSIIAQLSDDELKLIHEFYKSIKKRDMAQEFSMSEDTLFKAYQIACKRFDKPGS
jgi:cytochrome c553